MIKLPYSIKKFSDNLESNMAKRGKSKVRFFQEDYEETDMILWLKEHVGPMNQHRIGEIINGQGWRLRSNITDPECFPIVAWVEVEKEISDELQLDFILRFS